MSKDNPYVKRLDYEVKMISNGVSLDFDILYEDKVVASKNFAVEYRESSIVALAHRQADHHSDDDSGTYVPPRRELGDSDDDIF